MKEIDCDKAFIKDIFAGWYCIPNYQRPYVWETEQVEELLDCVQNACENKEEQYFLGSIVYKKNFGEREGVKYTEFELLDGQQRITTIFLIIAVIRDVVLENKGKIDDEEFDDIINTCTDLIYQKKSKSKGIPERLRIVFDIRKDVKDFVDKFIRETGSTSNKEEFEKRANDRKINTSIKHMSNTVLVARKFFSDDISKIGTFLQYLLNNVLLVYIATEDLQDAFQLFTVMNNTGLKLTNSDILKAENLKEIESESKQKTWAEEWEAMESYFGEDFDNFLSQIRTILVKRKADYSLIKEFNDNVYSERRWNKNLKQWESCQAVLKRGEETFSFLKNYFEVYQDLFDDGKDHYAETHSYEVLNYLTLMAKGFETDYWKAPVLMYFRKFRYEKFVNFLKILDNKLSCDWITGLVPSMRIDNMNRILVCIENASSADDVLKSDLFKIDKSSFLNIVSDNIYGRKYARYLLLKVDMLTGGFAQPYKLPATISIEHILPQTPKDESQWKKDFSDEERDEWTDKIGNLVLISRRKNSSQGNSDFTKKVEKYFSKNIEVFPSMVKVFQENKEWKLCNLQKRQTDTIKLLNETY